MAVTLVGESYLSRSGTVQEQGGDSVVRKYELLSDEWPTTDDIDIDNYVRANVPLLYDGLPRTGWEKEPIGEGRWKVDVTFQEAPSGSVSGINEAELQPGEHIYEFRFTAGTKTLTTGIPGGTQKKYGPNVPDHEGFVGVDVITKEVHGTSAFVPAAEFSETHVVPIATVTEAYKRDVLSLVAKTNDASFKGMNIGECLFMGATGSQRNASDWTLTFHFAFSPNREAGDGVGGNPPPITIGTVDITDDISGWEYVEATPHFLIDANGKHAPKAKYVHVTPMYESGDFSLLKIGT